MPGEDPIQAVLDRQRRWARENGITLDRNDRTTALDQNLFQPLNAATEREFARGAGNELLGDMRSIRSSAALACNVFDYWRDRDLGPLARACGADPRATEVSFERTFPTGLGGTPPHLDVVIDGRGAVPTAIESKFTEIYTPGHGAFRKSYFARDDIWIDLPRCRAVAEAIRDGRAPFQYLGAAQLIKHALGLQRRFGRDGFRLAYLWYEVPGPVARQHQEEVEEFKAQISGDVALIDLSYQEMFERLSPELAAHAAYSRYLGRRYFS